MRDPGSRALPRRLVPGFALALLAMVVWLSGSSRWLVICHAGEQHREIELSHGAEGCPDTMQECACEGDGPAGDRIHAEHHGACEDVPALGPLGTVRRAPAVPAPAKLAAAVLPAAAPSVAFPGRPWRTDAQPRTAPPPGRAPIPLVLRI